jgi:hypothetical protein
VVIVLISDSQDATKDFSHHATNLVALEDVEEEEEGIAGVMIVILKTMTTAMKIPAIAIATATAKATKIPAIATVTAMVMARVIGTAMETVTMTVISTGLN